MSKKQYAYSFDGARYTGYFDSIEEARLEASCHDEHKIVWVGIIVPPDSAVNFDLDSLIEVIDDNIAFEFTWLDDVYDFIDVTDIDLFESKIKSAIREHITPKVFSIENSEEYQNSD